MINNLKVKKKLFLFSAIMILLLIFIGGIGYYYNLKANEQITTMYNDRLLPVEWLSNNQSQERTIEANVYYIILNTQDNKAQEQKLKEIQEVEKNFDEQWELYKKAKLDKYDKIEIGIIPIFESNLKEYRDERNKVIKLAIEGNQKEALEKSRTIQRLAQQFQNNLKDLVEHNTKVAEEIYTENTNNFQDSIKAFIGIVIFSVIVGSIVSLIISKTIANPLKLSVEYIKELAKKDFTGVVPDSLLKRKDEIGELANAIDLMQKDIGVLVKEIIEKSQNMRISSEELSTTVEELIVKSANIEIAINNITYDIQETSAASEEISASMQEVDSSVNILSNKATEGSNNANQSRNRATEIQKNGKISAEETRKLYDEKKQKSLKAIEDGRIVENIKVMADTIASIAEEINLLSLNAAIEAARVGEQGKGFAVVADEVKKLAEQSSHAVSSIQDTIIKVQEAFEALSDNNKDVLIFIYENVNEQLKIIEKMGAQYHTDSEFVTSMSDEIASMSEELTATINQVSEAIQNTAENAQKSSENVETIKDSIEETTKAINQVSEAAQDQAEMAEKLSEMAQRFKI